MRFLRAFIVAILTAILGCILAGIVGDYLMRFAGVPDMEGQRGYMIIFVCAPLGIFIGLIIGLVAALHVRRSGLAGFLIAQGWAVLKPALSPRFCLAFHIC